MVRNANLGGKVSFSASAALATQVFPGDGLKAYTVANDGASSIVVELDGRPFTVLAGEVLDDTSSSGEPVLRTFAVTTATTAWRFFGRF